MPQMFTPGWKRQEPDDRDHLYAFRPSRRELLTLPPDEDADVLTEPLLCAWAVDEATLTKANAAAAAQASACFMAWSSLAQGPDGISSVRAQLR